MSEDQLFPVPDAVAKASLCTNDQYLEMYKQSVDDPDAFWGEQGKRLDWIKPYTKVKNVSYDYGNVSIKWY
ncbi:MAG TPA: acetyl-coenzyme A synthetase, partial [Rhodospirillaceae bacterium]|nr:acetyl-coenzyme A synthetase [Rhodospirillaceae bacterium]